MAIGRSNSIIGGKNPYIADTVEKLESYLKKSAVGSIVKYTGATTTQYKQNSLYLIVEVSTDVYALQEIINTTSNTPATIADIREGKEAYVNGEKLVGTVKNYNGGYVTRLQLVQGAGTALNPSISDYSETEQETYKLELLDGAFLNEDELVNTTVQNITGTIPSGASSATVVFDVSEFGDVGDVIMVYHKVNDSTWTLVYNGVIPAVKQITVTLSSFSPIIGALANRYYPITNTLSNVIADPSNPTTIKTGETITLIYRPADGYVLPTTVSVTGATQVSWTIVEEND